MALGKAINFISQFISDDNFRDECNGMDSQKELMKKFDFTEDEFENALNMSLVNCQSNEEAHAVKEIKMWFMIL